MYAKQKKNYQPSEVFSQTVMIVTLEGRGGSNYYFHVN